MDPLVISLIASAILGQAKSSENDRNFKEQAGINAMKDRFSGLTGVHGQTPGRPSQVDPMFQSLLAGAMMGQQLKKGDKPDVTTTNDAPGAVKAPGMQQSFAAQQNPYAPQADASMQQRFPFAY